jgi:hypothetical protein
MVAPVDVVAVGVTVIIDVPAGVPTVCGTFCGVTAPEPPPQPAIASRQKAVTAVARPVIRVMARSLEMAAKRARAPQHAISTYTRNHISGGSWSRGFIMVLFVVATVTT